MICAEIKWFAEIKCFRSVHLYAIDLIRGSKSIIPVKGKNSDIMFKFYLLFCNFGGKCTKSTVDNWGILSGKMHNLHDVLGLLTVIQLFPSSLVRCSCS